VHNEAPEVSEGNKQHSWLSLVPITIVMHPSASQKMVLMDFLRALFSYSFSWEMLCNAIPPSFVLFLGQSDGTSFPYLL